MKTYLLILSLLATAMNPVFSQKQLPPSIQPYAAYLGNSVKDMLESAGYVVPGSEGASQFVSLIKNRSDQPQLDSTITYHGYNSNGQDSLPQFKSIYTYIDPNLHMVTEYSFDQKQWIPLSRTSFVADQLGRLIYIHAQLYDDATQKFVNDSQIELFPRGTDMVEVDSFYVSGWAPELQEWHRLLAVWNTFDDAGRLQETLSSTEIFEFPIVVLDRYYYTEENQVTRIESFSVEGENEILSSRQSFFYVDNLLDFTIIEVSDGLNGFVAESKIAYTYTASGKQELIKSYSINVETNDWELNQVIGYGYDEEDRVILTENVYSDGAGGWDRTLNAYTYFKDELLATASTLTIDWFLLDKTYYFYNETTAYEPVDPVVTEVLNMWPNPATGNVQLDVDGEASVLIYGASGQLLKQVEMHQGDDVLDVSALPSGAYFVKAKTSDVFYSGQLIVQQ